MSFFPNSSGLNFLSTLLVYLCLPFYYFLSTPFVYLCLPFYYYFVYPFINDLFRSASFPSIEISTDRVINGLLFNLHPTLQYFKTLCLLLMVIENGIIYIIRICFMSYVNVLKGFKRCQNFSVILKNHITFLINRCMFSFYRHF